jgi:hypothetical protein
MGGEMQSNPDRFWASVQAGSGQSGNGSNGWFKTDWAGNSPNDFFALFLYLLGFFSYNSPKLFFPVFWANNCQNLTFLLSFFFLFFTLCCQVFFFH